MEINELSLPVNESNKPLTGSPENLKRTIGVFGLACAIINIIVGAGIFVLPALIAEHLGAAAILCYFICGVLIFLIALCFAEVGSKVTRTGGVYTYIETAFGPYAGFLANTIFLISCFTSDAAVAHGLLKTIGYFLPAVATAGFSHLFFLVLFGGLTWVNIRGAKAGLGFVVFITIAKLVPLVLLVLLGMGHINVENLHWQKSFGFSDIGSATLMLFFAFVGIETPVTNGGEIKNPSRTVPWGIFGGLIIVLILYVAVHIMAQGILGQQLILFKDAPLAEVSKRLFGYVGITIILIGTGVSMLGNLSGEIFSIPRVLYAGARDGLLPSFLKKVHVKYLTPHFAIIIYALLDYLVSVIGAFEQLVILASACTLVIYLGVELSVIKLRYKKQADEKRGFTIRGGIVIPVMAVIITVWVLSHLSKKEIKAFAIAFSVLSLIYFLMILFKKSRSIKKIGKDT